jgi:hypothetical protein
VLTINLWLWVPILITMLAMAVVWWMLSTREGAWAMVFLGPIGCVCYLLCAVIYLICWIILR